MNLPHAYRYPKAFDFSEASVFVMPGKQCFSRQPSLLGCEFYPIFTERKNRDGEPSGEWSIKFRAVVVDVDMFGDKKVEHLYLRTRYQKSGMLSIASQHDRLQNLMSDTNESCHNQPFCHQTSPRHAFGAKDSWTQLVVRFRICSSLKNQETTWMAPSIPETYYSETKRHWHGMTRVLCQFAVIEFRTLVQIPKRREGPQNILFTASE